MERGGRKKEAIVGQEGTHIGRKKREAGREQVRRRRGRSSFTSDEDYSQQVKTCLSLMMHEGQLNTQNSGGAPALLSELHKIKTKNN